MRFYFGSTILFVMIVANKLFLFNEEFLILISFLGFCFVIYENLSLVITLRFNEKTSLLKSSLLNSINGLYIQLSQKKNLNEKLFDLNISLLLLNDVVPLYLLLIKGSCRLHALSSTVRDIHNHSIV